MGDEKVNNPELMASFPDFSLLIENLAKKVKLPNYKDNESKYKYGVVIMVVLYLIFGYAAQILCNLIGVVYPAYVSIKAIESTTKIDDTKWLTYWVLYAVLSIFEYFSVVLTKIIPFYWLIKCGFLIWCMIPIDNNGSVLIYHRIIRPYFLKIQKPADQTLDNLMGQAKKIAGDIVKERISKAE